MSNTFVSNPTTTQNPDYAALQAYGKAAVNTPDSIRAGQQVATDFGTNTTHTSAWDTSLDAGVAQVDNTIKSLETGATANNPALLADQRSRRGALNVQRWRTANLSQSPTLVRFLQNGTLTYDDLANIDVSQLNDPAALESQVNQLVTQRAQAAAAQPMGQAAGGGVDASVTQAGDDAKKAAEGVIPDALEHYKAMLDPNNPDSALGKFDATLKQQQGNIEGTATRAARGVGGAFAGAAANHAGTNLQANGTAGRNAVKQDTLNSANDYIDQVLSNQTNAQTNLTNMTTDQRVAVQQNSLAGLTQSISDAVAKGQIQAGAQVDALNNAVQLWQAKAARGEESTAEQNAVMKLIVGLATQGGSAAAGAAK